MSKSFILKHSKGIFLTVLMVSFLLAAALGYGLHNASAQNLIEGGGETQGAVRALLNQQEPEKGEGPCGIEDESLAVSTLPCMAPGVPFLSGSICLVRGVMTQAMFYVYCAFVDWAKEIITPLLTLYVIFFSIAFMFSINDITVKDAAFHVIKILIIYFLITEPQFFYDYFYRSWIDLLDGFSLFLVNVHELKFVDEGGEIIPDMETLDLYERSIGIFAVVDKMFSDVLGLKEALGFGLLAIAFIMSGVGFWIGALMLTAMIGMVLSFFSIIVTYITALISLHFVLIFTPLFACFFLWKETRDTLFNGWIGALVSYTLQPMIILFYLFLLARALNAQDFITRVAYISGELPPSEVEEVPPGSGQYRLKAYDKMVVKVNENNDIKPPANDVMLYDDDCNFTGTMVDNSAMQNSFYGFSKFMSELKLYAPKFIDYDINQNYIDSRTDEGLRLGLTGRACENSKYLRDLMTKVMGLIVAFIVLNSVTAAFLKMVPLLAQRLSQFGNAPGVPIIGEGFTGGLDRFLNQSDGGAPRLIRPFDSTAQAVEEYAERATSQPLTSTLSGRVRELLRDRKSGKYASRSDGRNFKDAGITSVNE